MHSQPRNRQCFSDVYVFYNHPPAMAQIILFIVIGKSQHTDSEGRRDKNWTLIEWPPQTCANHDPQGHPGRPVNTEDIPPWWLWGPGNLHVYPRGFFSLVVLIPAGSIASYRLATCSKSRSLIQCEWQSPDGPQSSRDKRRLHWGSATSGHRYWHFQALEGATLTGQKLPSCPSHSTHMAPSYTTCCLADRGTHRISMVQLLASPHGDAASFPVGTGAQCPDPPPWGPG